MSSPKLHHFVPQAYLSRFGNGDQVLVKRRSPAKAHLAHVKNIAAQTGFYTVADEDGSPSTRIEQNLSDLETAGLAALRRVGEQERPPDLASDDAETLSVYLAVQMTRTPRKRTALLFTSRVKEYANGRPIDVDLMGEYLRRRHLGSAPGPREAEAAWSWFHGLRAMGETSTERDDAVLIPLETSRVLIPHLLARHWSLEVCRKPVFLTSDAPLVLWRAPSKEDAYKGFGLLDAEEVRFPVSPHAQLVLTPGTGTSTREVKLSRAWACNQDLADACEQVVVGHPDRSAWLDKITLSPRGPVLRFNIGPGFREQDDGSLERIGDVVHMWTTQR